MGREAAVALLRQWEQGVNAPWTTSAGRFLDAVAAWLGVCGERTYEGEPAMRLEAAAARGEPLSLDAPVRRRGTLWEVDLVSVFRALVDAGTTESAACLAATAQHALARGAAAAAIDVARERRIETVCLSGGVAVNDAVARAVRRAVEAAGFALVTNEWVPCGDGGVAFGQAAAAGRRWRLLGADGADALTGESHGKRDS